MCIERRKEGNNHFLAIFNPSWCFPIVIIRRAYGILTPSTNDSMEVLRFAISFLHLSHSSFLLPIYCLFPNHLHKLDLQRGSLICASVKGSLLFKVQAYQETLSSIRSLKLLILNFKSIKILTSNLFYRPMDIKVFTRSLTYNIQNWNSRT